MWPSAPIQMSVKISAPDQPSPKPAMLPDGSVPVSVNVGGVVLDHVQVKPLPMLGTFGTLLPPPKQPICAGQARSSSCSNRTRLHRPLS